jgi:hypothetical protein
VTRLGILILGVAFGVVGCFQNHDMNMTFHELVPVVLATNKFKDGFNIHPSFSTILKDKTRGGILLSNVILNLHKQNKLGLA